MKKWIILLIMVLALPIAAAQICQDTWIPNTNCWMVTPHITCTTYSVFNETGDLIENGSLGVFNGTIRYFNFSHSEGDYIVALCDNMTTREVYVGVDEEMGSVSITLFILVVTVALFLTPFFVRRFARHPIPDLVIRRGIFVVATYLMVLNSAIMATIAANAGLPLTREMFRYMWLFGWLGYGLIVLLVVKTLFDVLGLWKGEKEEERTG